MNVFPSLSNRSPVSYTHLVLNSYSELNTKLFREFQEWLIENVEGKNEDGTASPATLNKIVSKLLGSINKYLVRCV